MRQSKKVRIEILYTQQFVCVMHSDSPYVFVKEMRDSKRKIRIDPDCIHAQ